MLGVISAQARANLLSAREENRNYQLIGYLLLTMAEESPIAFRNVVRYVKDLEANSKLYQAVGFKFQRKMGDMHVLKNDDGLTLVLHQ